MKLNRKHVHALDIGIHTLLRDRDLCNDPERKSMLDLNVRRLRQLRLMLLYSMLNPTFDLDSLVNEEVSEETPFVKGVRALTGTAELDTP